MEINKVSLNKFNKFMIRQNKLNNIKNNNKLDVSCELDMYETAISKMVKAYIGNGGNWNER